MHCLPLNLLKREEDWTLPVVNERDSIILDLIDSEEVLFRLVDYIPNQAILSLLRFGYTSPEGKLLVLDLISEQKWESLKYSMSRREIRSFNELEEYSDHSSEFKTQYSYSSCLGAPLRPRAYPALY